MKILTVGAAMGLALAVAGAARAADETAALMKVINDFNDAANANKLVTGDFTTSQSVVDEISPHHWSGPGALKTWWSALDAFDRKNGITEPIVRLGDPTRVEQSAAHAYVVVPADFTFKQKGKAMHEDASLTVALDHTKSGWKIAAFTWSGSKPAP